MNHSYSCVRITAGLSSSCGTSVEGVLRYHLLAGTASPHWRWRNHGWLRLERPSHISTIELGLQTSVELAELALRTPGDRQRLAFLGLAENTLLENC